MLIIFSPTVQAEIRVGDVEAYWEDSIAVVRPEIIDPFSEKTRQALISGLPVEVELNLQLIRTGYVKHLFYRVVIEYNVWQDRYRVHTPLGPLAVDDYQTVLTLFRNDLVVPIHAADLPGDGPWLVKARAADQPIQVEGDAGTVNRIERELSGIAAWLFRSSRPRKAFSKWSSLVQLPKRRKHETER